MFKILRQDFRPYHQAAEGTRFPALRAALSYGFLAVCLYRYGRWAKYIKPRWLALPFKLIYVILSVPVELLFGINISINADIGPGLYIGHYGGIFLTGVAGRNLRVGQGVTVGAKGAGMSDGWPTLGDDVYLGVGSKIIGTITIGNGVIVGANTVVTKNVSDRMRVVGAAVRITAIETPPTQAEFDRDGLPDSRT